MTERNPGWYWVRLSCTSPTWHPCRWKIGRLTKKGWWVSLDERTQPVEIGPYIPTPESDIDTPFTRMATKYLECDAALRKKDDEIARLRFAARVVDAARKVVSPDITYLEIQPAHRELKAAVAEYDAAMDGGTVT